MADSDLKIILPDDEKILICPKCYTNNPEGSNFCLNCGFSLRKPSSGKNSWKFLIFGVLIVVAGIFYYHQRPSGPGPQQPVPQTYTAAVPAPAQEGAGTEAPLEEPPPPRKEEITAPSSPLKFPMGIVVIKDITGKVINEVPVPVVGGGWIALPKQVCLGGADWVLKMGLDTEVSIVGGIYSDYDRIGLWRILEDLTIDGPELYPWSANNPLTWISTTSDNAPEQVELENPREQGYFIEGLLAGDFTEAGILVQQGRAVGWTFGESAAGAFLWSGDEGKFLRPEIRVDDFYRITFANSREEEFTRALSMGADYSPLERLEALAAGFKYERRLSDKETPAHLQTAAVIERMRELIEQSLKAGAARAVAGIFDAQMLVEAADIGLLVDVGRATVQGYGFEDAADLARNVLAGLPPVNEKDNAPLAKFFSDLYQSWIAELLKDGDLQGAWRAYRLGSEALPDDAAIHLMGVQLAIEDNNWAEAEVLLAAREYPSSLSDKVQNLQTQISELKAREGKIVISFAPGTRQIPLTALLNSNVYQRFIIDTGASLLTIPRSTAEELGLSVDERNPMRRVFTAGGVKYAPEVNLFSINVEGWEEYNIKALVLDLPNQSEWGLLGMNYLRRFRMDINSEEGVMILEPR